MNAQRNDLTRFFPEIRTRVDASARACAWPEFEREISRHLTQTQLPLHVILPLASAAAVGGEPRRALPAAVACSYLIVAMRWFDDAEDCDRRERLSREVGEARAMNMAATALTVAWRVLVESEECSPTVLRVFGEHTVGLARGQDFDLRGGVPCTLNDYWELMRAKTGEGVALGCRLGCVAACADKSLEASICARFGEHLGVVLQILDDLDGAFAPDGIGDLRSGKVTLPVVYGLAVDHPAREELAHIVHGRLLRSYADRVLEILEAIDTREFLVWCAFEERRQALACLDDLPTIDEPEAQAGREALKAFADSIMQGWERLLVKPSSATGPVDLWKDVIACNGNGNMITTLKPLELLSKASRPIVNP